MGENNVVSLVLPGRNCQKTLGECLEAVSKLREEGQLSEVIFVNDRSSDRSVEIAKENGAKVFDSSRPGPAAARNVGAQAASGNLIWFLDSDCVAREDALDKLLVHFTTDAVSGVGGSFSNPNEDSLLACLIHEEIIERHLRMSGEVNHIATGNAMYRKDDFNEVGGFNEDLTMAQDVELSFRLSAKGKVLKFERDSIVSHDHPVDFLPYLKKQMRQGYWRVRLYRLYPSNASGDSYASLVDFAQPPLAMVSLALLALSVLLGSIYPFLLSVLLLLLLQLPMTLKIVRRLGLRFFLFAPFSAIRAYARGLGMSYGTMEWMLEAMVRQEEPSKS